MEVLRQSCHACGSTTMVNILARAVGESDKVYVQCASCKTLVARYTIAQGGYYHHGKGFESYLRSLNRGGFYESTQDIHGVFDDLKDVCEKEFKEILSELGEEE